HHSRNPSCGRWYRIMCPEPYDHPPVFAKIPIGIRVADSVRLDFCSPPLSISLGPCAVAWTSVPEAAVDENGYPRRAEYDVSRPGNRQQRTGIYRVTQSLAMERGPKRNLARCVPLSGDLHSPPHDLRRCPRDTAFIRPTEKADCFACRRC